MGAKIFRYVKKCKILKTLAIASLRYASFAMTYLEIFPTTYLKQKLNRRAKVNINLNLPPELENELCNEASQINLTLSEYILRLLSVRQTLANSPKTGAELVAYWQNEGVINSRPDITDSQAYARQLRHEWAIGSGSLNRKSTHVRPRRKRGNSGFVAKVTSCP